MPESEEKKYRVALLQHPVPPNDLGEITETELYGYLAVKVDEATAKIVQSELEQKGTTATESEGPLGVKTRIDMRRSGLK